MTDVGELVVRIKADSAQMQSEMRAATHNVQESAGLMTEAMERTRRVLENLGIAIAAREIIEFGKNALETADNIYIMAERIGFAGSTLSALNIPLKQNGSSIDEFASSMKFMSRNIELAAEGNQQLIARFDSLGLSVTRLKALTPEEQFNAIAKALAGVTDQGQFTTDGMAIMGRGFQSLAPLIKETGGNIAEFTDKAKAMGNALTDEQIARVHEYEDGWISFIEHLKIKVVEGVEALDEFKKHAEEAMAADTSTLWGTSSQERKTGSMSEQRPGTIVSWEKFGPEQAKPDKSGKGGNGDIATPGADSELDAYIQSLKDEAAALNKSKLALAEYRAEKEASNKAATDFKNGLRDSKDLTDDERSQIDAATDAYERQKEAIAELQKEEQKHIQMVAQMEAQISSSLADIAVHYKSVGATVTSVLQQIAKQIIEMQITTPLVQAIGGTKSSPGLLGNALSSFNFSKLLGFADGGEPPVGVPSIVGENGPELFVPKQAGTVIPNGQMGGGGTTVVVQQTFHMQPGLPETVGAAIRQSAPQIAAMAHSSVMQAIQNGGSESRIVGRRS